MGRGGGKVLHEVVDAFFAHFGGCGVEVAEGAGGWDWRGERSGSRDGLVASGCG